MSNFYQDEIDSNELAASRYKVDAEKFAIFSAMNGVCKRDGNMWGAGIGDLPAGCFAFEDTRAKAILQCVDNLYCEKPPVVKDLTEGNE